MTIHSANKINAFNRREKAIKRIKKLFFKPLENQARVRSAEAEAV
jgi:hypothetical protein